MRVLFVLEGAAAAPQDIVRGRLYKPLLEAQGVRVRYVRRRPMPPGNLAVSRSRAGREIAGSLEYKVVRKIWDALGTWMNEGRIVRLAARYDVVHLIKVRSLHLIRSLRAGSHARLIYDLGDALWLPRNAWAYPNLREILSTVDAVTCDNEYGLRFARTWNRATVLWPPSAQVELFDRVRGTRPKPSENGGRIVLGWIGSPSTVFHLYAIWEALEAIFKKFATVHLRLVGVGNNPDLLPPFEHISLSARSHYSPQDMVAEVLGMDIGLFPMFDVEEARTRGLLKALIYMSGEAALVCSPRGQCVQLIQDGVNGLLADSREEWISKLSSLIVDGVLRRRLTTAALETVRSRYTLEKSFEGLRVALGL